MKIRSIKINHWRHFQDISLELGDDPPLVCIVGANGTGKSHILELIASSAHDLGLSPGVEVPRGSVYKDPHSLSLEFYLADGVSGVVDAAVSSTPGHEQWDRTLKIVSIKSNEKVEKTITAGGFVNLADSHAFASHVVNLLRSTKSVHFLSLDADRAYPKRSLNINQVAEAYEIDWAGQEYTKGRSFRTSATLYDEWMKYFLAKENQAGTALMQSFRRAAKAGEKRPDFTDHFSTFAASLRKVLPHMEFTGVDSKERTLLFDTTGLQLTFNQLSGGEREIAFQIGQIDRFGLRQGLFLLDEPELHLNADLIRHWVGYLTSTVQNGQIWLATHSLEAVEAAGPNATFVLERNDTTKKVDSLARLDSRPVIAALSRAVGTPAFSISQLKFIYVEGEERLGERERFRKIAGNPPNVRFMEGGSCTEVQRRLDDVKKLAAESAAGIHIAGIVDRDFRRGAALTELQSVDNLLVLPVHELENLFLAPTTLQALLEQNGVKGASPSDLVRIAADARAGAWIFQHAMAMPLSNPLPKIAPGAKDALKSAAWSAIENDSSAVFKRASELSGLKEDDAKRLTRMLAISLKAYARERESADFWQRCEGKQVLNDIAGRCGFTNTDTMISAATALWERDASTLPAEVLAFRAFVVGV